MPPKKTPLEKAAGKLISSIQKEWGEEVELGNSSADISEDVMNKGHDLLRAAKNKEVNTVLGDLNVTQYLGELWVRRHPSVKQSIARFEMEVKLSENV